MVFHIEYVVKGRIIMAAIKEKDCCKYSGTDGLYKYKITKNLRTGRYILYRMTDGEWVKTKHEADSPLILEEFIRKDI